MSTDSLHHLVISLDVQDSGQRTDSGQLAMRDVIYYIVQVGFTATGIDLLRPPEDRGDGVLLVLPASVPKKPMLGRWVEEVRQALRERNSQLREPVRIRIGIHAGEVANDDHGITGADVNIACRLASCEVAKGILRAARNAVVVVAISDVIYRSVVRHGGPFIDAENYQKYELSVPEYEGPTKENENFRTAFV